MQTVNFVSVERVTIGQGTNKPYFNGPQLNDGGQIKSFRFENVESHIELVKQG